LARLLLVARGLPSVHEHGASTVGHGELRVWLLLPRPALPGDDLALRLDERLLALLHLGGRLLEGRARGPRLVTRLRRVAAARAWPIAAARPRAACAPRDASWRGRPRARQGWGCPRGGRSPRGPARPGGRRPAASSDPSRGAAR